MTETIAQLPCQLSLSHCLHEKCIILLFADWGTAKYLAIILCPHPPAIWKQDEIKAAVYLTDQWLLC